MTGRRIYVHEDSFKWLAEQGDLICYRVYEVLATIRLLRIAGHHIEQAADLGLLSDARLKEIDAIVVSPLLDSVADFLRAVGHRPRAPRSRLAFRPLLLPTESIVAVCSDSGYLTFATSPDAARDMYADHVPLRQLRRELHSGSGPADLTLVNGEVLALIDPSLGFGDNLGRAYDAAIKSRQMTVDVVAKLEAEATQKTCFAITSRLSRLMSSAGDEVVVLRGMLDAIRSIAAPLRCEAPSLQAS